MQIPSTGTPVNLTATGTVRAKGCFLLGFYVNSTNAGTLVLKTGANGTTNGTATGGTITPAVGWNAYPLTAIDGIFATIGGTALDVTFFVQEGAGLS